MHTQLEYNYNDYYVCLCVASL